MYVLRESTCVCSGHIQVVLTKVVDPGGLNPDPTIVKNRIRIRISQKAGYGSDLRETKPDPETDLTFEKKAESEPSKKPLVARPHLNFFFSIFHCP